MFPKIFKKIFSRQSRIKTIAVIAVVIIGAYFGYQQITKDKTTTQYALAAVEKGALIVSISGSGQVSASDQIDIKPKVSGDIVYANIKSGQEVKAGELLAKIDARDAEKAMRDAETSLETAKLELEELLSPADELTLLQAENSLIQAKESRQKAEENLAKDFEDGFNAVVSAFFDLPSIMTDMEDILYGSSVNKIQDNIDAYGDMIKNYEEDIAQYKDAAAESYALARNAYDQNLRNYKNANRYSEEAVIEALVTETYEDAKKISETIKDADNFLSLIKDTLTQKNISAPTILSTHQTAIKNNTAKTNSILSNLLSVKTAIRNDREAILSAERTIEEKELSLAKLKAGADELEIRTKKIAVQQKEDALLSAKQNLGDCYIYSPFEGIVAEAETKRGDSVSAGATMANIITKQKIAEISLNEVDAAKVKTGQKATLTFDAIEDLSISGAVAEVDAIGTVTQGVVYYNVKIVFDTQDERVKPGMSASAAIITDMKQNVLLVPNSAVKSNSQGQYIEVLMDNAPQQTPVETGLSNDTMTEIISGLQEGDKVITQTVTGSTATTQTSSQNRNGGFMMMGAPR